MVNMVEGRPSADAALEASAAMRARFELLVMRERTWRDGLSAAMADIVRRALAEPALARAVAHDDAAEEAAELHMRRRDRRQWVDMLVAAWQHHHAGAPPVCRLEFFLGALRRVVAWRLEHDDITPGELRKRLRTLHGFVATETSMAS